MKNLGNVRVGLPLLLVRCKSGLLMLLASRNGSKSRVVSVKRSWESGPRGGVLHCRTPLLVVISWGWVLKVFMSGWLEGFLERDDREKRRSIVIASEIISMSLSLNQKGSAFTINETYASWNRLVSSVKGKK